MNALALTGVIALGDAVWLPLTRSTVYATLPAKFDRAYAALAYGSLILGLYLVLEAAKPQSVLQSAMIGAAVGLAVYGVWNGTGGALFPDRWTAPMALIDTLYGTALCAAAAAAAFAAAS